MALKFPDDHEPRLKTAMFADLKFDLDDMIANGGVTDDEINEALRKFIEYVECDMFAQAMISNYRREVSNCIAQRDGVMPCT